MLLLLHLLTKCSPVQTVRHLAVLILSALKTTIDAARAAAAESIGEPLPVLRVHSEHVMTLALQRSGGCSTAATSATARAAGRKRMRGPLGKGRSRCVSLEVFGVRQLVLVRREKKNARPFFFTFFFAALPSRALSSNRFFFSRSLSARALSPYFSLCELESKLSVTR